jgi:hypothetical protein
LKLLVLLNALEHLTRQSVAGSMSQAAQEPGSVEPHSNWNFNKLSRYRSTDGIWKRRRTYRYRPHRLNYRDQCHGSGMCYPGSLIRIATFFLPKFRIPDSDPNILSSWMRTLHKRLGMHRILILPDIRPAGYPAKPKAGYRISGKGRIPDIRPDTWVDKHIFGKISNKFVKTILDFCKHQMKHDLETKLIFLKFFF